MRKKLKPIRNLRSNVWDLMSEWTRRRYADWRGMTRCFTCQTLYHWKDMNAGHFIHKDHLDFDEINIHPQCVRCNKWLSGNLGVYAARLIEVYGLQTFQELEARRHLTQKFSRAELEKLKIELKVKIIQLKN